MATLFQAPQYVPSAEAADPSPWAPWADAFNANTLDQLITQKVFGAGGQVPTKRYLPHYTQDDNSSWQWQGPPSDTLRLLTFQTMFGAGGQVPTKRYLPHYTQDDSSYWYAAPTSANSTILQASTEQKWPGGGAPGQVPDHQQRYDYDADSAQLRFWPIRSAIIQFLAQSVVTPYKIRQQVLPWQDDPGGRWQAGAQPQANTINLIQSMFAGKRAPASTPFLQDDPAIRHPHDFGAQITTVTVVFPLIYWWPTITDDAAGWHQPVNAMLINSLLNAATVGGQPGEYLWDMGLQPDDPWQWRSQAAASILQTQTSISPFVNRRDWGLDDSSVWLSAPVPAYATIALGEPFPSARRASRGWWQIGDDSSGWGEWLLPHEARSLYLGVIGGNPFSKQWRYDYDDVIGWLADPVPSGVMFQETAGLPVFKTPWHRQWDWEYNEGGFWSGAPTPTLFFTNPGAFQPASFPTWLWPKTYDDPPVWYPSTENLDADALQLLTNPNLRTVPGLTQQVNWAGMQTRQDDSSGWLGAPIVSRLTTLFPALPIFPVQWKPQFGQDDPSVWYPTAENFDSDIISILASAGQPKQHLWTPQELSWDDSSFWMGKPQATLNTTFLIGTGQTAKNWAPWLSLVDDPQGWAQQTFVWPLPIALQAPPGIPSIPPQWVQQFAYDDSSLWYPTAENFDADIINILGQGGLLGGGRWPTHNWNPQYTQDDSATWDPRWWQLINRPQQSAPVLAAWNSGAYMTPRSQFYYMAADETWPGRLQLPRSSFLPLQQPTAPVVQQIFEWLIRARRRRRR